MKHALMSPGDGHACPANDDNPSSCVICDGGLAVCRVCGGAEGAMPDECPGIRMTGYAQDQIYAGFLNFRDGAWRHERSDVWNYPGSKVGTPR